MSHCALSSTSLTMPSTILSSLKASLRSQCKYYIDACLAFRHACIFKTLSRLIAYRKCAKWVSLDWFGLIWGKNNLFYNLFFFPFQLIWAFGCGWGWLTPLFFTHLYCGSAWLPCPHKCTQRAEVSEETRRGPVILHLVGNLKAKWQKSHN